MDEDVDGTVAADSPDSSVGVLEEPVGDGYTIKVDGVEEQVSLDELRDGYQRQSDYTRKTQELASERGRLQQAEAIVNSLEADPAGTLEALGNAFGVERTTGVSTTGREAGRATQGYSRRLRCSRPVSTRADAQDRQSGSRINTYAV